MDKTRLVLQRKPGEAIIIGDTRVTIQEIKGKNRVSVIIEAPKDVYVNRAEVQDRIDKENKVTK